MALVWLMGLGIGENMHVFNSGWPQSNTWWSKVRDLKMWRFCLFTKVMAVKLILQ